VEIFTGELRKDLRIIRPEKDGDSIMLFDPVSENYFRITPNTALILGRMNKNCPLEEFEQKLTRAGIPFSHDELLGLISFLQQNNLTAFEVGAYENKKKMIANVKEQTWLLRLASVYMFFKLPPWHPDRFLKAVGPYVSFFAGKFFLYPVLLVSLLGYLLVLRDFSTVRTTFLDSLSWAGLAKYFAAIILLKIVHESSHALAAVHFNCRVRAFGVSFIVFYPRLFTDTTDSWRLPRRQRLLIDAGGLIGELLLGGIAALLWCYLPPGAFKSTMFYIFAVSSLSTILMNGNPLIRYDGYYILCDLLNAENLMMRSTEFVKNCWRYYLLRIGTRPREKRWLLFTVFGIAAFLYKIVLYTSIILMIYNNFVKAVAVVLLLLEVYTIFLYPMYKEFKTIKMLSKKAKSRAGLFLGVSRLVVVGAALFLPLSWSTVLPGEVLHEKHELVTVAEGGYLKDELADTPRDVRKGELLFEQYSPHVDFAMLRTQKMLEVDTLLYKMQLTRRESMGDSMLTKEKIKSDILGKKELARRRDNLVQKAAFDGKFVPRIKCSAGIWLPAGFEIGELHAGGKRVMAYASDREVFKFAPGDAVVIYSQDQHDSISGKVLSINPIAAVLRNSPLLQHFGGEIPVYPDEKKPGEYISVLPLYRVEIAADGMPAIQHGRVVRVKLLRREVLAGELWKFILSVLRREF
jgi:putative peptide zinc metalloprotease protein